MSTYTITAAEPVDITSPMDIATDAADRADITRDPATGDVTITRADGETITFNTEEATTIEESKVGYIYTTTIVGATYSIADRDGTIYDTKSWPVLSCGDVAAVRAVINKWLQSAA